MFGAEKMAKKVTDYLDKASTSWEDWAKVEGRSSEDRLMARTIQAMCKLMSSAITEAAK